MEPMQNREPENSENLPAEGADRRSANMTPPAELMADPRLLALHSLGTTLVDSLPSHWNQGQCRIHRLEDGTMSFTMSCDDHPDEEFPAPEELQQAARALPVFWPQDFPVFLVRAVSQDNGTWKTSVAINPEENDDSQSP